MAVTQTWVHVHLAKPLHWTCACEPCSAENRWTTPIVLTPPPSSCANVDTMPNEFMMQLFFHKNAMMIILSCKNSVAIGVSCVQPGPGVPFVHHTLLHLKSSPAVWTESRSSLSVNYPSGVMTHSTPVQCSVPLKIVLSGRGGAFTWDVSVQTVCQIGMSCNKLCPVSNTPTFCCCKLHTNHHIGHQGSKHLKSMPELLNIVERRGSRLLVSCKILKQEPRQKCHSLWWLIPLWSWRNQKQWDQQEHGVILEGKHSTAKQNIDQLTQPSSNEKKRIIQTQNDFFDFSAWACLPDSMWSQTFLPVCCVAELLLFCGPKNARTQFPCYACCLVSPNSIFNDPNSNFHTHFIIYGNQRWYQNNQVDHSQNQWCYPQI